MAEPLTYAHVGLLLTPQQIGETLTHPAIRQALQQTSDYCATVSVPQPRWPGGSTLPHWVDVREACEYDQQRFMEVFFPADCHVPFSPMHLDFFARADQRHRDNVRGWRDATAAPRGGGKTTVKGKVQVVHAILYGYEKYILICSSNAELAVDKVREIRDIFTTNDLLREVYGAQETRDWKQADFITVSGSRVRAFTPKSRSRGLLWRSLRPSLILLDDAEDQDTVLTDYRRTRFKQDWFYAEVTKLGTRTTNIDVIGTLLHPESLLADLLKNPGYRATTYAAVARFSTTAVSWDLWRQWREIVIALENPQRLQDAHLFYLAHEAEMLEGTAVLWPERESYYELMLSRVVDGEASFWKEKQNQPQADSRTIFAMGEAAYCDVHPGEIVRANGQRVPWSQVVDIVAYWDPTPDKERAVDSDYACCAVVAKDVHGYMYVVDMYLAQEPSTEQQMQAIARLLAPWQVPLLGLEANTFQGLLKGSMAEVLRQTAQELGLVWECRIIPVVNTTNKGRRILTLEPMIANHWLQFSRRLPPACFQQFSSVIALMKGGHDDAPDAVEGAVRVGRRLLDRRSSEAA